LAGPRTRKCFPWVVEDVHCVWSNHTPLACPQEGVVLPAVPQPDHDVVENSAARSVAHTVMKCASRPKFTASSSAGRDEFQPTRPPELMWSM